MVLGWLVLHAGAPAPAHASALLELANLSSPVIADGKTPVDLRLSGVDTDDIRIVTSAGTVTAPKRSQDGWRITLVPPNLIAKRELLIHAMDGEGARLASVRVEVIPDSAALAVGTQSSGGAFAMQGPERLILGEHESVPVTFTAPDSTPKLRVNVGSLSAPARQAGGAWEVVYTPPADRYPQIAIVTAVANDGSTYDWLRIPLWGRPNVDVSSEANATVRVELAGETYGPIILGATGKGSLRVLAPPGRTVGKTHAQDALGNTRTTELALSVPSFNRVVAVCPRAGDVRVLAFVTTQMGAPLERSGVEVRASGITMNEPSRLAPGVFESRWTQQDDLDAASYLTTVWVDDKAHTSTCKLVPGALPTRVDLNVSKRWHAGDGPLTVEVELRYPTGEIRREVEVDVRSDVGAIRSTKSGQAARVATLELPDDLRSQKLATIEVFTRTAVPLSAVASVELLAGPPARLDARAADQTLVLNESTVIRVRATDRFGNPVPVRLSGESLGTLGEFRQTDVGEYVADYQAPKQWSEPLDPVTIRHEDDKHPLQASVPITVRRRLESNSAALAVGYVTNFGKISGPSVSLRLGLSWRVLQVGLESGYYASTRTEQVGGGDLELRTRVVPLLVRATYEVPFPTLRPYAGVGVGAVLHSTEVRSALAAQQTLVDPLPSVSGILGAGYPAGPGRAIVELQYLYAPLSTPTIEGNLGGFRVSVGYHYAF